MHIYSKMKMRVDIRSIIAVPDSYRYALKTRDKSVRLESMFISQLNEKRQAPVAAQVVNLYFLSHSFHAHPTNVS